MGKNNFSEEDKTKLYEFLNMVAKHAKFDMNTTELLKYARLLNFMQTVMIPKVEANILEIKRVIESKEQTESE